MRNFRVTVFTWAQTYREIFKSALVCLWQCGLLWFNKNAMPLIKENKLIVKKKNKIHGYNHSELLLVNSKS